MVEAREMSKTRFAKLTELLSGAPNSFLLLVVRPGAPNSVLAPSSKARSY